MKIIISPAKKLNIENGAVNKQMQFNFTKEASVLINILQNKSVKDIKQLMSLSDNLATLNWQRYQQWAFSNLKTYHAILMFNGDVYQGLKAATFNKEQMHFANKNLRILSGLYGLLKPLDRILPYRLEMGTKLNNSIGDNLYKFWGDKLNKAILSDMNKDEVLINLASNEYSKALQLHKATVKVITPIFKDYKNGKLKVISFFAKKARGEMVNFIIKNKIVRADDLKLFTNEGYAFSEEDEGKLLFVR
tara:strand:- start:264 stop:1007 length:744 start_codon:yes stop_codon:yes gene_type:complete